MNCKRIKKRFLMGYMEGNLEPNQKTLVEDHLANCAQCRDDFEHTQRIGNLLKSYTIPDPGEAFWDRLSLQIYYRVNREKPAQKKPWEILEDWITWKKIVYTAIPILLILLLFPVYHLQQSHFLKLIHQEKALTVQEIGDGFSLIEENLTYLPANQMEDLVQKLAGLILNAQILAESGCLTESEWAINEEVYQMPKEGLDLLMKRLKVYLLKGGSCES